MSLTMTTMGDDVSLVHDTWISIEPTLPLLTVIGSLRSSKAEGLTSTFFRLIRPDETEIDRSFASTSLQNLQVVPIQPPAGFNLVQGELRQAAAGPVPDAALRAGPAHQPSARASL